MRKIETKEQEEKRRKRNHLLIGIIMISVMILGTSGYAFMSNESGSSSFIKYNGIKFYGSGGYWKFSYNGQEFLTQYTPTDTENISVKTTISPLKYSQKVLYFDTESGQPNNEIDRNLNAFILKTNGACLSGEECNGNYPIKDCSIDNIIVIREPRLNETERIYQEGNCVFIKAYEANQTRFIDAFLFKLIGI